MASRYKEVEPLTSKDFAKVAKAFLSIYRRSPSTSPHMLQVDHGRKFMGSMTKEMENHNTFAVVALKFTEIRPLSSVSTARLQNACFTNSMPWKCSCLRASGELRGSKGFPKLSVP